MHDRGWVPTQNVRWRMVRDALAHGVWLRGDATSVTQVSTVQCLIQMWRYFSGKTNILRNVHVTKPCQVRMLMPALEAVSGPGVKATRTCACVCVRECVCVRVLDCVAIVKLEPSSRPLRWTRQTTNVSHPNSHCVRPRMTHSFDDVTHRAPVQ